ncbi:MAG: tyrosinase family protein [Chloroflexia bacterium]
MSIRKNAKFLTAVEREALVQAFVSMKADIVNPGASASDQYSRWDEYVAIHRFIQNANTPSNSNVNFGHGGAGAYGFFSWHRYFLYLLEKQLQTYVAGVALPYWDWTDPSGTLLVADFLGPNGDSTSSYEVRQGYFAKEAPGTGSNTTPTPSWWPASLTGWNLHTAFGSGAGALKRNIGLASALPSVTTIRSTLDKTTYHDFQNAVESGSGTSPSHGLHNSLHGWFGSGAHMASTIYSPFDPIFYLHHCNADRLWALWQMDGHETEYPTSGGDAEHHRTDPMYPWVGGAAGYSSNYSFPPIVMPDFSALGVITPEDVLDHRALGYCYDSQVVMGVALDRTGSMMGMTPDPMTTAAPDVTKWEAAKRGISAFLQDCEVAYESAEAYVVAGVETFRRLAANDFSQIFAGTPYGLIKSGSGYSAVSFDTTVAGLAPGGSTPLADALADTHTTLVVPPFGSVPTDERRYLALFTDGLLTSGSPLSSIPDGSLTNTAVFAMGFGTGADVDYTTLAALVAKGETLTTTQVFHGENAGVIDKFYSQALAAALGFTPVTDPVIELFEGEHTHLEFTATSAEETFFLTAQGMDFADNDWSYHLVGPDGHVAYATDPSLDHGHAGGHHCCERRPNVTARRRKGRLTLFVARDNADTSTWVGSWTLLIAWRARALDAMVMLDPGELMLPVAAGPARGPRYARLLLKPGQRIAARAVPTAQRHRLDIRPPSTGRADRPACSVVVNVYARTRLRVDLRPDSKETIAGNPFTVNIVTETLQGSVTRLNGLARLAAPAREIAQLLRPDRLSPELKRRARLDQSDGMQLDSAIVFAAVEAKNKRLAETRDEERPVVTHHEGTPHIHVDKTRISGVYHVGVWLEGTYQPGEKPGGHAHMEGEHGRSDLGGERFVRLLSLSVGLPTAGRARRTARKASR